MAQVFTWVKHNVWATITLCLTVVMGMGGFALTIYGFVFSAKYQRLDRIFERDQPLFGNIGVTTAFCGSMILVMSVMGCVAVIKDLYWIRIYWVFAVWFLSATVFFISVGTLRIGAPGRAVNDYLIEEMTEVLDDALFREYHVDVDRAPKQETPSTVPNWTSDVPRKLRDSKVFNRLHRDFECCGSEGSADFAQTKQLPPSCCRGSFGKCLPARAYPRGCAKELVKFVENVALTLGILMLIQWVITVIVALCTTVLFCMGSRQE